MFSPLRSSTNFTDTRLKGLLKSQDSTPAALTDSFLTVETKRFSEMTESFSKTLRNKIRQEVLKSPGKKTVTFEDEGNRGEKQLLKRGEDYTKYVMGQISTNEVEKDREKEKIRLNVDRALRELDEIKTNEGERLRLRVDELKKNYQMSINRLERSVMKQIEQLRGEFSEEIYNEELESDRRIKQATEKLANSIAPETKKSVMEKVFNLASVNTVPMVATQPVRSQSTGKRHKMQDYNTPEKKKLSLEAMNRLSESRRKVQQLHSVPVTPLLSEAMTPLKLQKETSEGELQFEDLDYFESRASRFADE